MTTATFFFAGSSHGLDYKDDSMGYAYMGVKENRAYFPGPGGSPEIFVGDDLYKMVGRQVRANHRQFGLNRQWGNIKASTISGQKLYEIGKNYISGRGGIRRNRAAGGKGWNRNAWFAVQLIYTLLKTAPDDITINMVGHSRGSITIIMLLNDIFAFLDRSNSLKGPYKIGDLSRVKNFQKVVVADRRQYERRLKNTWKQRFKSGINTEGSVDLLNEIRTELLTPNPKITFNAWLFDPVAGPFLGNTTRKLHFPLHRQIKRVRVLRMLNVPKLDLLSNNLPPFDPPNWELCDNKMAKDLWADVIGEERLLIPMVGSHGAGLSTNKGKTTTIRNIGTDLMLRFLTSCGTIFDGNLVWLVQHIPLPTAIPYYMGQNKKVRDKAHRPVSLTCPYNLFYKYEYLTTKYKKINVCEGRRTVTQGINIAKYINAHHRWLRENKFKA